MLFADGVVDQIVRGVEQGQVVDLGYLQEDTGTLERRAIAASELRGIILQTRTRSIHPRGVRIRNAIVQGQLDLANCQVPFPIEFWNCEFIAGENDRICAPWRDEYAETGQRDYEAQWERYAPVVMRRGHFHSVIFHGCRFRGGLLASDVHVENDFVLDFSVFDWMVWLNGGTIRGSLRAQEADFRATAGYAFNLSMLRVEQSCFLVGSRFSATVYMQGADVGRRLWGDEARFDSRGTSPALVLDNAVIGTDCLFREAVFGGDVSAVSLIVNKRVSLRGCQARREDQPLQLGFRGARIRGDFSFRRSRIVGWLDLSAAEVEGDLRGDGCHLHAPEAVLILSGIKGQGDCFVRGGELAGRLQGDDARFGGDVVFDHTRFLDAVDLTAIQVDGDVSFRGCRIHPEAASVVRLQGGTMRALNLRGAVMHVNDGATDVAASDDMPGVVLDLERVVITRDVDMDDGFHIIGLVLLDHASVGHVLNLRGGRFTAVSESGLVGAYHALEHVAITMSGLRVGQLIMPLETPAGITVLRGARADVYVDDMRGWYRTGTETRHIVLDGFVYDQLRYPAGCVGGDRCTRLSVAAMRIRWLSGQSPAHLGPLFRPFPWLQLIAVLRRNGREEDARLVDIERRRRARRTLSPPGRLLDFLFCLFAGYGYKPWVSVGWSVFFVLAFWLLWAGAMALPDACTVSGCHDQHLFIHAQVGSIDGEHYPAFNPFLYSLDVFFPFFDIGYEHLWAINTAWKPLMAGVTLGGLFYAAYLLEILLGVVLTALMVFAFMNTLHVVER